MNIPQKLERALNQCRKTDGYEAVVALIYRERAKSKEEGYREAIEWMYWRLRINPQGVKGIVQTGAAVWQ